VCREIDKKILSLTWAVKTPKGMGSRWPEYMFRGRRERLEWDTQSAYKDTEASAALMASKWLKGRGEPFTVDLLTL
jgi:hypothetical protein